MMSISIYDLVVGNKPVQLEEKLKWEGGLVNAEFDDGDTPLLLAIRKGYLDIVRVLLCYGASLECKTKKGNTPELLAKIMEEDAIESLARYQGKEEEVRYYQKRIAVFQSISECLNQRKKYLDRTRNAGVQEEIVSLLLESRANVNTQDRIGRSPLHLVKSFKVAEQLINAGGDLTLVDDEGKTPLDMLEIPAAYSPLVESFIEKHNRVPQSRINTAFEKCERGYDPVYGARVSNRDLLDEAYQSLTGKVGGKDVRSIMKSNLGRQIGHLLSWKGSYAPAYEKQGEKPEMIKFEGHVTPWFLAIRGRVLFEIIFHIRKDMGFIGETVYPGEKESVLAVLNKELRILLDMLHTCKITSRIEYERRKTYSSYDWAYAAHIKNVCGHIFSLSLGEEYQIASGYPGHATYTSFEKKIIDNKEVIIYRMDNLGAGVGKHICINNALRRDENRGGVSKKALPYALKVWDSSEANNIDQLKVFVERALRSHYYQGYDFCLMTEGLPCDDETKRDMLYVVIQDGIIHYKCITPGDKIVKDKIAIDELRSIFNISQDSGWQNKVQQILDKIKNKEFSDKLLEFVSKRNHIRYKKFIFNLLYEDKPKLKINTDTLTKWYPWRRLQNVGNCVAKNHSIGMQIRFGVHSPFQTIGNPAQERMKNRGEFYQWFRGQEPKFLPMKDYSSYGLEEAVIETGCDVVDAPVAIEGSAMSVRSKQFFSVSDKSPSYNDIMDNLDNLSDSVRGHFHRINLSNINNNNNNDNESIADAASDLALAYKSINEAKARGYNKLHFAIIAGHDSNVKKLISDDNLSALTEDGHNALHLAILYKRNEILDYLLRYAKEANLMNTLLKVKANDGDTILHLLARQSNVQIRQAFRVFKANGLLGDLDFKALNNEGRSPQYYATNLNLITTKNEVLLEASSGKTILAASSRMWYRRPLLLFLAVATASLTYANRDSIKKSCNIL